MSHNNGQTSSVMSMEKLVEISLDTMINISNLTTKLDAYIEAHDKTHNKEDETRKKEKEDQEKLWIKQEKINTKVIYISVGVTVVVGLIHIVSLVLSILNNATKIG